MVQRRWWGVIKGKNRTRERLSMNQRHGTQRTEKHEGLDAVPWSFPSSHQAHFPWIIPFSPRASADNS